MPLLCRCVDTPRRSGLEILLDLVEDMYMRIKDCIPRTDWLLVGFALLVMLIGAVLTLTWIGAIVGVPMFVASLDLLYEPKTLRDPSCL